MKALTLLKAVLREAGTDNVGRVAASLAYCAVFALPGLLVLVIGSAGAVWGWGEVEARVLSEMRTLVGQSGAEAVREMISAAARPQGSSLVTQVLAVAGC